jgi:hypothetical protein
VSLRGFWNKRGQRLVSKTQFTSPALRVPPAPAASPEGTWIDHPDLESVKRAQVAQCTLPKVNRHDS